MINIPSIHRKELSSALNIDKAREIIDDILIEYDTGFTQIIEDRHNGHISHIELKINFKIKNEDKNN